VETVDHRCAAVPESNPSHRPFKGQSPPTACRPVVSF
jgi:hypothetical protein